MFCFLQVIPSSFRVSFVDGNQIKSLCGQIKPTWLSGFDKITWKVSPPLSYRIITIPNKELFVSSDRFCYVNLSFPFAPFVVLRDCISFHSSVCPSVCFPFCRFFVHYSIAICPKQTNTVVHYIHLHSAKICGANQSFSLPPNFRIRKESLLPPRSVF